MTAKRIQLKAEELIKIRAPVILKLGSVNGWLGPEPLGRAGLSLEGQI